MASSSENLDKIESILKEALTKLGDESSSSSSVSKKADGETLESLEKIRQLIQAEKERCSRYNTGVLSKFQLNGQVAVITGGSRGIGRAFAFALGEAGCRVAVASINLENAEETARDLQSAGIESLAIQVDVAKKDQVEAMVKKVVDTWGDLHIAVNNAGITKQYRAEEFPEKEWDELMDINLKGVFLCCQAEAKHMLSKGYGKIINNASISAQMVNRPQFQSPYNCSKAGVVQLTKALASEWADRGVTVNSISPGYVDTDMIKAPRFLPIREQWLNLIPMKRFGEYDDMKGVIVLLASKLSNYMTGSDVVVDGGYLLW